ncbi:MAG: glycosyltransferase family 4 protein [Candidatus Omnitrophica bacterium]|nr:glycosyltransferase family 4 protein [Candidatus Omnitrophota bacterium]
MNVLFVVPRIDKASSRYRVLQYVDPLKEYGIQSQVIPSPKTLAGKVKFWITAPKYDILIIQKKLYQPWEFRILRSLNRRIVYDLDDAVMFKDRVNETDELVKERKFPATIRSADLIIAGNNYLQDQIVSMNPRVAVLPTSIDLRRYKMKSEPSSCSEILIGWIGARKTLVYLKDIQDALEAIGKRHPHVKVKIIADDFLEFKNIPVIRAKWSHEKEIEMLQSLDIGVMPLPDNAWTRGKCGFKLLQYMAVGVSSICSPVGVNRDIVEHEVNGLWAGSKDEWVSSLSKLIEDKPLRRKLGLAGRLTVESHYSLEVNAPKLAGYLHELMKSK